MWNPAYLNHHIHLCIGEFLFLFRIRFGLMSVLSRLRTRANWYRLERACIGRARSP